MGGIPGPETGRHWGTLENLAGVPSCNIVFRVSLHAHTLLQTFRPCSAALLPLFFRQLHPHLHSPTISGTWEQPSTVRLQIPDLPISFAVEATGDFWLAFSPFRIRKQESTF